MTGSPAPPAALTRDVCGQTASSVRAAEELRSIVERFAGSLGPERAEQDHVLAAPTLIRHRPGPRQGVVADLRDVDGVLRALGFPAKAIDSRRGEAAPTGGV